MSETTPAGEPQQVAAGGPPGGTLLKGTTVAPGLVLGPAHRKDYDLLRRPAQRVPLEQVERELNRFHRSLTESKRQLEDLKLRLEGRVPADQARILDTHLAYLRDSVFLSDVENLILNEQMSLAAAIAKVIADFDRIFRLVQNETLRERAVDLRDVGIRVLRNLERDEGEPGPSTGPSVDYVLVARELSIVDMFNLQNEHVLGIVTEEGGLTSHAAILARAMRIPTLTGIEGLLEQVREGDFLILDATEGVIRLNPDELVRAQYAKAREEYVEAEERAGPTLETPDWAREPVRTRDGEAVTVGATCGNLPEVAQACAFGLQEIALYRTELLYLIEREPPSLESLVAHYSSVLEHAHGAPVTFRLLHVDSSLELGYLHRQREPNPALGLAGVRALLAHDEILRRQARAILRAALDQQARIALPFVVDCGELRRVKEILFEERYAMRKAGERYQERVEVGVVIETPASIFGVADLAREADFLVIGLDGLLQYVLAADRENHDLRDYFAPLHPFALRALERVLRAASEAGRSLSIFGASATSPENLPFLLGLGLRHFGVSPVVLRDFLAALREIDLRKARRDTERAMRASTPAEVQSLVDGYRHGYAR